MLLFIRNLCSTVAKSIATFTYPNPIGSWVAYCENESLVFCCLRFLFNSSSRNLSIITFFSLSTESLFRFFLQKNDVTWSCYEFSSFINGLCIRCDLEETTRNNEIRLAIMRKLCRRAHLCQTNEYLMYGVEFFLKLVTILNLTELKLFQRFRLYFSQTYSGVVFTTSVSI